MTLSSLLMTARTIYSSPWRVAAGMLLFQAAPVFAATDTTTPSGAGKFDMSGMGQAVFAAFILALLLESALALIFNWRPFVRNFDGRGIRSIISLVASWIVVQNLHFNLIDAFSSASDLSGARAAQSTAPDEMFGRFITAMIVAGGSQGVNRLLVALGFRSELHAEDVQPKPPADKAWLSVKLLNPPRNLAPVQVMLSQNGEPLKLIGMIDGRYNLPKWLTWFVRDPTRFPTAGGYAVPGDQTYSITLQSKFTDDAQNTFKRTWSQTLVAKGAVIDIVL